jgi:ABC-type antimicrobial peptide transport system permease subunit
MKTNVCLTSTLRKPFNSLLLLILFGLISFGFITKAVGFILVQRETEVLGSYYRSIGVLENVKDPKSGDVSAGVDLIKTSPYFAYGDQRQWVSGVMPDTYNSNIIDSNSPILMERFPKERWPNVHNCDLWFVGELTRKEEVKTKANKPEDQKMIGYYLGFNVDTLLAAYPEVAKQGGPVSLIFTFEGNEAAIPLFQAMKVGQRYFIHGWDAYEILNSFYWENAYGTQLQVIPLDDRPLWYLPLAKGASIDFSSQEMAAIKNEIDVLNENLHALSIIATADMSAMPRTQEAARYYFLVAGRWLNRQDDLAGAKLIVVPEELATKRGFKLEDKITLTFRPLKDTYVGYIRDSEDNTWRSYPTYQDTYKIVGIYNHTSGYATLSYIPISSLRPGFTSSAPYQFRFEADYSFVLDSSRHETWFMQAYKDQLQALGISLTFLANNGPAYWASVDPIRRSSAADLLVFGLLLILALVMAVFLYVNAHKRDYAILRALGVPARQANGQLALPLLFLGGLGILAGGLPSWNYALNQARATISTLPTPAGVTPSADLSVFFLAILCEAIFIFLELLSWMGVSFLANTPVFELLQGQTSKFKGKQKGIETSGMRQLTPTLFSSLARPMDQALGPPQAPAVNRAALARSRSYAPFSLSQYVVHHVLRSRLKSFLTLAVALGFVLAAGWIRQTIERSRIEIDRLYDTTVVEADVLLADQTILSSLELSGKGSGFAYLKTIEGVLNSGFIKSNILEAATVWTKIKKLEPPETIASVFPVYAYDGSEAFYSGLADPDSLVFVAGWDMDRFAQPRTLEEIQKDGIPALFPSGLLEQLQLEVGQQIRITDQFNNTYPCMIIGKYSEGRATTTVGGKIPWFFSPTESILISLSALEAMERSQTRFTVAHFTLDPTKNRQLSQFRTDIEAVLKAYGAGIAELRIIVWDEELRIVVAQLEKNISLLSVLYPVVMAVSVLNGASLCFLLLLQTAKEAAILRVLGTTRTAVRLTLIAEPLFLSILGVIIGLGIARLLWMTSGLVAAEPLLIAASLYLAGVLAGLVASAIAVTNKKPIELLQVKE